MNEISPNAEDKVFAHSLGKPLTLWMVIRSAKIIEKAKQLQEKAKQRGNGSRRTPPHQRLIAEIPEKAIAYCDAVREFTQQLTPFLGDHDDLDTIAEGVRTRFGELAGKLHQNSLMK